MIILGFSLGEHRTDHSHPLGGREIIPGIQFGALWTLRKETLEEIQEWEIIVVKRTEESICEERLRQLNCVQLSED